MQECFPHLHLQLESGLTEEYEYEISLATSFEDDSGKTIWGREEDS